MRIALGDKSISSHPRRLTRTTLVLGVGAAMLILAIVTVTVLLFVNRAEAAEAAVKASSVQTHLRDEVASLTADRDAQSDRADAAESSLASCASAYDDQKSVTDDLRDAVRASYASVSVTLLGGSGDTSSVIAEIRQINERESAIDASDCVNGADT